MIISIKYNGNRGEIFDTQYTVRGTGSNDLNLHDLQDLLDKNP
jgi:hypothetical protein